MILSHINMLARAGHSCVHSTVEISRKLSRKLLRMPLYNYKKKLNLLF